jgi:hypothetical protein
MASTKRGTQSSYVSVDLDNVHRDSVDNQIQEYINSWAENQESKLSAQCRIQNKLGLA